MRRKMGVGMASGHGPLATQGGGQARGRDSGGRGKWEPEHRTYPETHGPGEVAHREAPARKIRFAFNKTRLDAHVTRERVVGIKSAGRARVHPYLP